MAPPPKSGTFVWRRRSGANDEKKWFVSVDHEYVHCFANPGFSFTGTEKDFSKYTNPDRDKRGKWTEGDLSKQADFKTRPNTFYPFKTRTRKFGIRAIRIGCGRLPARSAPRK